MPEALQIRGPFGLAAVGHVVIQIKGVGLASAQASGRFGLGFGVWSFVFVVLTAPFRTADCLSKAPFRVVQCLGFYKQVRSRTLNPKP